MSISALYTDVNAIGSLGQFVVQTAIQLCWSRYLGGTGSRSKAMARSETRVCCVGIKMYEDRCRDVLEGNTGDNFKSDKLIDGLESHKYVKGALKAFPLCS